jgi:large repetitive protein
MTNRNKEKLDNTLYDKKISPHFSTMRALEPRVLLDAAFGETIQDLAEQNLVFDVHAPSSLGLYEALEGNVALGEPVHELNTTTQNIVFIDSTVEDISILMNQFGSNADVHILNGNTDGVLQIAHTLKDRSDVNSIHIISHGQAGSLTLGSSQLTLDSINSIHADSLAQIRSSLSVDADLLIYGCDFAQGTQGQRAVDALVDATGADIAASIDVTGAAQLGGNWQLESQTGVIESKVISNIQWQHILPINVPTINLDVTPQLIPTVGTVSAFTFSAPVTTNNGQTEAVHGAGSGETALYVNVGTVNGLAVDLKASVISTSGGGNPTFIASGGDAGVQLGSALASSQTAQVRWQLFVTGTTTPIVGDFSFLTSDIDHYSATQYERISIDNAGVDSYTVAGTTDIVVNNALGNTIFDTLDADLGVLGIAPDNSVRFNFSNTSEIIVTYQMNLTADTILFSGDSVAFFGADAVTTDNNTNYANIYTERGTPVEIADIDMKIADDGNIKKAVITLTNPQTLDKLNVPATFIGGVSRDPTSTSNTIILTGIATPAAYETAIKAIRFENTSLTPNDSITRLINVTVTDDTDQMSNIANAFITVVDIPNIAPVLDLDANNSSTALGSNYKTFYTENTSSVSVVDSDVVITDVDGVLAEQAVIRLTNAFPLDSLQIGLMPSGISAFLDTSVSGEITVILSGSVSFSDMQLGLQAIRFISLSENPNTVDRVIEISVSDGLNRSTTATTIIGCTTTNDNPTVDLDGNNSGGLSAGNFLTSYTENGTPTSIADTDVLINDLDDIYIENATIKLTNGKIGDLLSIGTFPSNISVVGGITPSVLTANGTITIQLAGTASLADYQTALRAIGFLSYNENMNATQRDITIIVNDGTTNSNTSHCYININPVNDSPVATDNVSGNDRVVALGQMPTPIIIVPANTTDPDSLQTFSVQQLLAQLTITDVEQSTFGIGVVSANETQGVWEFRRTDLVGHPWTLFNPTDPLNTDIQPVPVGQVILFGPNTEFRFIPDGYFNSVSKFHFKVWDQSSGTPSNVVSTALNDASGISPFATSSLSNATFTALVSADTDGDGIGNSTDIDDDKDGILDVIENPSSAFNNAPINTNGTSQALTAIDGKTLNVTLNSPTNAQATTLAYGGLNGYWLGNSESDEKIDFSFSTPVNELTIKVAAHTYNNIDREQLLIFVNGMQYAFDPANLTVTGQDPSIASSELSIIGSTGPGGNGVFTYVIDFPAGISTLSLQHDVVSGAPGGSIYELYVTGSMISNRDTDGDGFVDSLDLDSDNDGITDNVEAQTTAGYIVPSGLDTDQDGLDNSYDRMSGPSNSAGVTPVNTDAAAVIPDTIADYLDFDSDNDGVLDIIERGDGQSTSITSMLDTDKDGLLDIFEAGTVSDGFDVNDSNRTASTLNIAAVGGLNASGSNAIPLTTDLLFRDVNDLPILVIPILDQITSDGTVLTLPVTSNFFDADGDGLNFSLGVGTPSWVSINPLTGVITANPPANASQNGTIGLGLYDITVIATDRMAFTISDTFRLTISNIPPVAVNDVKSVGEDAPSVSGSVLPNDSDGTPDSDPLVVTLAKQGTTPITLGSPFRTNGGGILTLNADGSYTFAPGSAYNGLTIGETATEIITYTISDGNGGLDTATLTITINGANDAPVIVDPNNRGSDPSHPIAANSATIVPVQRVSDGQAFTAAAPLINIAPFAVDPDGDPLTFSTSSPLPAGLTLNPNGTITGTIAPNASQGGDPLNPGKYTLTIMVSDGISSTPLTIVIDVSNIPPVNISPIPPVTTYPLIPFNLDTSSFFKDPDGDPLTYLATGMPAGFGIDPITGVISGRPAFNSENGGSLGNGVYEITITVDDQQGGTAFYTFLFTVKKDDSDPSSLTTKAIAPVESKSPPTILNDVKSVHYITDLVSQINRFENLDGDRGIFNQHDYAYQGGIDVAIASKTITLETLVWQDIVYINIRDLTPHSHPFHAHLVFLTELKNNVRQLAPDLYAINYSSDLAKTEFMFEYPAGNGSVVRVPFALDPHTGLIKKIGKERPQLQSSITPVDDFIHQNASLDPDQTNVLITALSG